MKKIIPVVATIALAGMLVSCGAKAPVEQIPLTPKTQAVETKTPEVPMVPNALPTNVAATGTVISDGLYINSSGVTVDTASGVNINYNGDSLNITSSGTSVNSTGMTITNGEDGTYINTNGNTIDTTAWLNVNSSGTTISSQQTGELNTDFPNMQITNSGSGQTTITIPQTQVNQTVSE